MDLEASLAVTLSTMLTRLQCPPADDTVGICGTGHRVVIVRWM